MIRAPIFAAIKTARGGKAWKLAEVKRTDAFLSAIGVPEDGEPKRTGVPQGARTGLAAIVGATAAAGLFMSVPADEGTSLTAYRDIVGVWTICQGDTKNVASGMKETPEGCRKRLETQLVAHALPVMQCTPRLAEPGRDNQRWAAVSLAYNIGAGAYCRSGVDRAFDAGNWRAGCDALRLWRFAGGKAVRGLTTRRERERAICLKGLS